MWTKPKISYESIKRNTTLDSFLPQEKTKEAKEDISEE